MAIRKTFNTVFIGLLFKCLTLQNSALKKEATIPNNGYFGGVNPYY